MHTYAVHVSTRMATQIDTDTLGTRTNTKSINVIIVLHSLADQEEGLSGRYVYTYVWCICVCTYV